MKNNRVQPLKPCGNRVTSLSLKKKGAPATDAQLARIVAISHPSPLPSPDNSYCCVLASVGNPDFGQYAPLSPKQVIIARTVAGLLEGAKQYISKWDLGGGNFPDVKILHPTKGVIGRICYSGRALRGLNGFDMMTDLEINTPIN